MLDQRLAAADPALPAEMERLGRRLARLHQESPVCRQDGGVPNLEVVRANWQENFRQSAPFAGSTISARALRLLAGHVDRFLEENAGLLQRREDEGYVRDGHGDLHAEHICLTEPIRIYDCIEFNRRFRIADVAADLAFLLMDLDFRRRRDLGARLRAAYLAAWEGGPGIDRLLPFYQLYRAFVRGKVESFLAADSGAGGETRQQAAVRARAYFNLALAYLCPPMLVLTCGLMGTGKSTLGAALAGTVGASLLRSDALRKELAGNLGGSGRTAAFGQGIYSAECNRRTYDLLLQRSRELLTGGGTVVADATFARRAERDRFRQAAAAAGVPCFIAVTDCDRATALARLDSRQAAGSDLSDGRRELFDRQAAAFEPVGADEGAIRVDTQRDLDYNLHLLLGEIIEQNGTCR